MPPMIVKGCFFVAWVLSAAVVLAHAAWAEPLQVRMGSFNIRLSRANDGPNGWEHRKDFVVEVLQGMDADFLALQEAWPEQTEYLQEHLPAYRHLVRSREVDPVEGEAVPIFYRHERWQPDPAEQGHFWLSDTPETPGSRTWRNTNPRMVTWARFTEHASGRGLYVYNVHLDHISEFSRQRSVELLLRRMADRRHPDPVIVAGDFNAGEASYAVEYLQGRRGEAPLALVDTFRRVQPEAGDVGTFHGFSGGTASDKIDYIFVSPPAEVRAARILHDQRDGRYPSDHFPVIAEIAFP